MLSPQTSTLFNSGANHDFVSLQREPAHHEYNESVTSPSEDKLVQSEPNSEESGAAPTLFVQKREQVNSGYQHPFGLLVKEHTQKKAVDDISFPTIKDFKIFIESMKSSFLMPGSDLSRHFQTARQTVKNEIVASGAQNIEGESSNSVEGSAHDDSSENEIWSEPMNSVFKQNEQGSNYEMPSESLSEPDQVISTEGLISPSAYESQDSGPGSALYPRLQQAATEYVSNNHGRFSNSVFSGENPDPLTRHPNVQNEDVQSTSYMFPEQTLFSSSSLYGEDSSFRAHVTASPLDPPISPAQHLGYSSKTSNKTPLTSEKKIQQSKYTSHSKDAPTSSYGKSFYVSSPRDPRLLSNNIPDQLPTHGERRAPPVQRYQPTVGKESKDINLSPIVHLPVSSGSVSSSSNILSPQSSRGYVGVQASSQHDPEYQVFSRKQPIKSHLVFTAKPSSSPHGSSRRNVYLGDQSVSVPHPSSLYSRAKDEEKSDLSEQALVPAIQESKHMTENTPVPIFIGSDVSFNSVTNLTPSSKSKKSISILVGDEVMSRNFKTQNISDMFPTGIYGARKSSDLFSSPLREDISLNKGIVSATRAGLLQTFIQPTKEQKRPANVNKKPGNVADESLKLLSTSKMFGSPLNGVQWRDDGYRKRLPLQTGPGMPLPSVNAYIVKSRNSYVRSKASLSKTRYTPHVLTDSEAAKGQWKPAQEQRKYYNTASHNVKELEEK